MATETQNGAHREQVEMGKLFAEIMNLLEDTRRKEDEREKLRAEARKMESESQKLNAETKWHPIRYLGGVFVAAVIFLGAVIAVVKAFLS